MSVQPCRRAPNSWFWVPPCGGGYSTSFLVQAGSGDSFFVSGSANEACFAPVNEFIEHKFALLAVPSFAILAIFAALKMLNRRVAWFLSLSAPGAIAFTILTLQPLTDPRLLNSFLAGWVFLMFLLPGWWVFPTVFADLPLNFHPAAIRASAVDTPFGAV